MEKRKIWFKGAIVLVDQAKVNILSPTAQFGINVFEGIRFYWNNDHQQLYVFRLSEHLDRLLESCKLIGINCPYSFKQIESFLFDTIHENQYREDIAVRMTIFIDGEGSWSSVEPVEMFIAPIKKQRTNPENIKGLSACVSTWERISDNCFPPRIKAGANYINGRYGQLEAKRNGYDLPIFLGRSGKVAEGAGACLFMVRRGVLITPTLTSSVLESITRATLLDLAEKLGFKIFEREIDRTELYLADEVFLCGSAAEITPIISLDRIAIGTGLPGEITISLLRQYLEAVCNTGGLYSHWTVPVYR